MGGLVLFVLAQPPGAGGHGGPWVTTPPQVAAQRSKQHASFIFTRTTCVCGGAGTNMAHFNLATQGHSSSQG